MSNDAAIFAFSGVDCAGKSTQIARATTTLAQRGLRSTVFWLRPGYSRELDALRSLVRKVRPGSIPAPGSAGGPSRARAFARRDVRLAWVAMALVDIAAQYTAKLRALRATHDVVLCDRYLLDAEIDFALRFPELSMCWRPALAALRVAAPRPDAHFLLVLPHDELLRRAAAKDEPFPDSPAVREARYQAYVAAAAETGRGLHIVDSGRPIDDVEQTIGDQMISCLERRRGPS